MKKHYLNLFLAVLLSGCATTGSVTGISLMDAIEQTGEMIATQLPKGSRVAIVNFDSPNDNLSDYIMEELTGALFDHGIEVVDRQNLEFVYRELDLQMSGNVSDESAKSIGKFLGADMVVTGQLVHQGDSYRYRASAIYVEQATRASVTRLTVRDDPETRRLVSALANQTMPVKSTKYGVSEQSTPETSGTFLDRGIMFADRGDFETAIMDFSEAIRLDPNYAGAYYNRGVAYYFRDDYDAAIEDHTQAIRLDPSYVEAYMGRGNAYSGKRDYNAAIEDHTQAIRLDPGNVRAYMGRGYAYRGKRDYYAALRDFNQALGLDPNYAAAYSDRGYTYYRMGDYDSAIADYTQAIGIEPDFFLYYMNRRWAYLMKGDNAMADADTAKLRELGY